MPKDEQRKLIALCEKELYEVAQAQAAKEDRSLAALVRQAMRLYLANKGVLVDDHSEIGAG